MRHAVETAIDLSKRKDIKWDDAKKHIVTWLKEER